MLASVSQFSKCIHDVPCQNALLVITMSEILVNAVKTSCGGLEFAAKRIEIATDRKNQRGSQLVLLQVIIFSSG